MTGREMQMGPTGDTVRANVAHFRQLAGLTFAALSKKLGELGRPIPPLGLRRVEAGDRRVDVDDLVALAIALEVNPHALLFPRMKGADIRARVTGAPEHYASRVWSWGQGWAPLVGNPASASAFRERVRPHEVLGLEERAAKRREWIAAQIRAIEEQEAQFLATGDDGGPVDPSYVSFGNDEVLEGLRNLEPEDDAAWADNPDDPAPPSRGTPADPRDVGGSGA